MVMQGKFDSVETEQLYEISLDGFCDDQLGDVDGYEWYGKMSNTGVENAEYAILYNDSQGFVYSYPFETEEDLNIAWAKIQVDYAEWGADSEMVSPGWQ